MRVLFEIKDESYGFSQLVCEGVKSIYEDTVVCISTEYFTNKEYFDIDSIQAELSTGDNVYFIGGNKEDRKSIIRKMFFEGKVDFTEYDFIAVCEPDESDYDFLLECESKQNDNKKH